MSRVTVILPSYDPGERLPEVVAGLIAAGFCDIIVIDDGSREDCRRFFDEAERLPECTVLHHGVNRGKGRALKTGFGFFMKNRPEQLGVVCADDDGQHSPEDIARCAAEMVKRGTAVFGARDFTLPDVPPKSRFGNRMTSFVFRALCGIRISDTQTGLRAFPREYLPTLCETAGERFEYETNALLELHREGLGFSELPIKTIYINNNGGTHFHPLRDSVKIYAVILKFLMSSCAASLIDMAVFTAINLCLPAEMDEKLRVFAATFGARAASSLVNFIINRNRVFKSSGSVPGTMARYYLLCGVQTCVSWAGVTVLAALFSARHSGWETLIKAAVDTVLFFVSFGIQRDWVFGKEKGHEQKQG
ncbi:MAG: glycosyltransferase [Oscillospiraceae bacterium]